MSISYFSGEVDYFVEELKKLTFRLFCKGLLSQAVPRSSTTLDTKGRFWPDKDVPGSKTCQVKAL